MCRRRHNLDNGSAFSDASLTRICARLGIRLIHSRPYRPQGRGKIERFFGRVTSEFLTEIATDGDSPVSSDGGQQSAAGSAVGSLDELNALFTSWVEVVYHRAIHSTTGQSPLARWQDGWAQRRPRRKDPEVIAEAFRWSAHRTVTKTGTVSLHANTYQVDPLLAGARVELIYDPFDLTAPIAVTTAGDVPAGEAVLLEISRHVHPKAVSAAADADDGAKTAASGIDYLRLIETRHKQTMSAQPITFTSLADRGEADTDVLAADETAHGDQGAEALTDEGAAAVADEEVAR